MLRQFARSNSFQSFIILLCKAHVGSRCEMAGMWLRSARRCKDPLFRLASNSAWELSKQSLNGTSIEQCCAFSTLTSSLHQPRYPISSTATATHFISLREFSQSHPLYSVPKSAQDSVPKAKITVSCLLIIYFQRYRGLA